MAPIGTTGPAGDAAHIVILGLGWQRVQLEVSVRLPTDRPTDADALRLARVGGEADEHVAPTHTSRAAGGEAILRFNVMQGPDLMPLEAGRWELRVETTGGRLEPVIVSAGAVDVRAARVAFPMTEGRYTVTPAVLPDGAFVLDVAFDPTVRLRPDGSLAARGRRLVTRLVKRTKRAVFLALFAALRATRRRSRPRVVFVSDARDELLGNLRVVRDRMVERGLDRRLELVELLKGRVVDPRGLGTRLRLTAALARSDVVVIDDYQPAVTHIPAGDVRIVQLWHASGAFKTVGYSRVGKLGGPSAFSRVHKNYDAAIVSSEHDVPFYAEAFGIPESRVLPTGIPRMDRFFDPAYAERARAAALEAIPEIAGRSVVLFAPTFRGLGPADATYDLGRLDLPALHAAAAERDAVIVVKLHPFVRERLVVPPALADRIVDATDRTLDVNDLLFAVDVLVTDYSSIVFEFAALERPMIFFAYDLDEYVAERDFYVPFEAFVPGPIARTSDELIAALRGPGDVDRVRAFARRHFAHLDGTATDRVIDEIIVPFASRSGRRGGPERS